MYSLDLSEYILFQIKKYCFIYNIQFLGEKWKNCKIFFCSFFSSNYFQSLAIYKFWWFYGKNLIKIYQTISSFCSKQDFNLIKNRMISSKKWEIQVILFMIMPSRSSAMIFNQSGYTGCIYNYAHSLFGKEF